MVHLHRCYGQVHKKKKNKDLINYINKNKMKKTILFAIALFITLNMNAQENTHKFDFKIGTGLGFMGSGDLTALCFENELNYKLNNYFSTSISLGIGRSIEFIEDHNDYLQGSLNLFISPFRNDKRNNFKIGLGYTRINETSTYLSGTYILLGTTMNKFDYSSGSINGFNMIIENEYSITSRFLIGGKLFVTGGIDEGGIVSGGMIKLGIAL